jgi:hypothetical protein
MQFLRNFSEPDFRLGAQADRNRNQGRSGLAGKAAAGPGTSPRVGRFSPTYKTIQAAKRLAQKSLSGRKNNRESAGTGEGTPASSCKKAKVLDEETKNLGNFWSLAQRWAVNRYRMLIISKTGKVLRRDEVRRNGEHAGRKSRNCNRKGCLAGRDTEPGQRAAQVRFSYALSQGTAVLPRGGTGDGKSARTLRPRHLFGGSRAEVAAGA